ncbi:MAG: phenylacetate--CoA ligase family protein [Acidobacteria bacterium]|nr:phenylacetate--CoA ligase family protein [Acidobacteriota bacterium]
MKAVLRPLYYRLPATLCYGKNFAPTLQLLRQSQYWSAERLYDYQLTKLRAMLRHCAANVPYYRRLFRQVGFDPQQVRSLADLQRLPLLDKATVRDHLKDLIAENLRPHQMHYFTTGGTMGVPLGFYNTRDAGGRERAFMVAQWERLGFDYRERRAMLRGTPIKSSRHWQYDPSERAFVFSNFHMTATNVAEYARVMQEKHLPYLHSYPSAVIDFARLLQSQKLAPPPFKAILASSETVYPGQREFVEAVFKARLFSWYGHSEDVVLAGECEVSSDYHIFAEYSIVEVLKEDGSLASVEGEAGELIGSALDNFAMPLIRYRTDDWAVLGRARCACGRNYQLLKETRGRRQDMIIGRLDNLISPTALNFHTDVFDRVLQVQFYQREKGKVELRIKRRDDYTAQDSANILAALNEKMGDTVATTLHFVPDIPLSPSGKARLVIQELPIPQIGTTVNREQRSVKREA